MSKIFVKTKYGNQKEIGKFENGVATFRVYENHFFQKAGTFGIDVSVLDNLKAKSVKKIQFLICETFNEFKRGDVLVIDIKTFEMKSWVHSYSGFDPKTFCGLHWFDKIPAKTKEEREEELLKQIV